MAIPVTSRYSEWNAQSEYHALREGQAVGQVSSFLEPYIASYIDFLDHPDYSIADFACGHGSVSMSVMSLLRNKGKKVSRFGLLDVAPDNLPVAAKKIEEVNCHSFETRIETFKLNGSDLSDYKGEKFDFVYCWDAMVHFDILDIVGYIKSFANLCQGRALFHHSNYYIPTQDISTNPHWRNFMSDKTFRQICISSGFKVLDQKLLTWDLEDLDCLTYVEIN